MGTTHAAPQTTAGQSYATGQAPRFEDNAQTIEKVSGLNRPHEKINPRDLAGHYRATRKRLMSPPSLVPEIVVQRATDQNLRELARLRVETKIFREFLTSRGVDIASVINRKEPLCTDIKQINLKHILDTVCLWFMVPHGDLLADRRLKGIVNARHVAFYLARNLTFRSTGEIGRAFGKDHTTIIHGSQRITRLLLTDASLAYDVAHLEIQLEGK